MTHGAPSFGTVGEAEYWGREALRGSPSASLDAQVLLGHVLDRNRSWILAHPEYPMTREESARFADVIERRTTGEPVAYLRGWTEWYGMHLRVNREVLIPRPETELLVEQAVTLARRGLMHTLADIGTGSGAIAIQLARALPDATIYAIDCSMEALRVARMNVVAQGVAERVVLLHGELIEPLPVRPDLVVANLPYLSDSAMESLPLDVRFEPMQALFGGKSGVELYERMFRAISVRHWKTPVLLEIAPDQTNAVGRLWRMHFPPGGTEVSQDYSGQDRILLCEPGG